MTTATLKTVIGETHKVDFGDRDTPRDVLRNECRDNIEAMIPFFGTREKAMKFAEDGALNIQTSQFSLVNGTEKALSFDFDIPILEQIPDDKKVGAKDSLTFLVTADTVVGSVAEVLRTGTMRPMAGARLTNEIRAYGAFANALSLYFGGRVDAMVRQCGSDVEIVVKSFPVYGERGARDVILHLPGGLIIASSKEVKFRNPLNSESVRILLDNGRAFPHAHVWDNGMPCWNDNSVKSFGELFTTFVNTLMWMNISKDSRDYGHFTKCVCTDALVKKGVWKEVDRQRAAVSRVVGFEVGSKDPLAFYGSAYRQLLAISMG